VCHSCYSVKDAKAEAARYVYIQIFNIILETRASRYLNTIAIALIRNFATLWQFILLIMAF